jgi:hypothetical protein
MLPTPINPITIFSLGGEAPFAPNTEDGTIYGKPTAPNAVLQTRFKNCRRFMVRDISEMVRPYQVQISLANQLQKSFGIICEAVL